jgi:hypothetical protein
MASLVASLPLLKRKLGCAIIITPANARAPAIASILVKGSYQHKLDQVMFAGHRLGLAFKAKKAINAVKVGVRKVMTVASARFKYERESEQLQYAVLSSLHNVPCD